jgi:lactate dehydrogenase-like 2-hydroxyacid dehydrogenase
MAKPVILQLAPYPEWDQAPLDAEFDARRVFEATDPDAFLARHGPDARAIAMRGTQKVDKALLAACPNLELIAVYGVGYDGVDLVACRDRGIQVTNTPDVLTGDVADLGVAMMLALARNLVGASAWVRSGDWQSKGGFALTKRVFGARAGILGMGRIGQAVARRLSGFDMAVSYCDLTAIDTSPDWHFVSDPAELARQSDVLFVTLSATAQTRDIVNAGVIDALGPDGMLINFSRASNIDEDALISALQSGRLGSAALDVFDGEPKIDPRFLDLKNVLLQPHHASGTIETRQAMGQLMRDNLTAHFAGRPLPTPVP